MKLLCEYEGDYFVSEPVLFEGTIIVRNSDGSTYFVQSTGKFVRGKAIDINDLDRMAKISSVSHLNVIGPEAVIKELNPFRDKNGHEISKNDFIGTVIHTYDPAIYRVMNIDIDYLYLDRVYDPSECYESCSRISRECVAKYWTVIS